MQDWLGEALDAMPAALVVFDPNDRVLICNSAYKSHFHPFEDQIIPGMLLEELLWLRVNERLDAHAADAGQAFVDAELENHRLCTPVEEWQDDNGRYLRRLRSKLPNGSIIGMGFDVTDLRLAESELRDQKSELEAIQRELRLLATTDNLTGLTNRRAGEECIAQMMSDARAPAHEVTVLAADLDGFKQINDRYGHAAGDTVLRIVSRRLTELMGPDDLLARMGGDEFVIALAGKTASIRARDLAQSIIKAVAEPMHHRGKLCQLGISLGIATHTEPGESLDVLMGHADLALYQSKRSGRNRFTEYTHAFQAEAEQISRLSLDLLQAIDRDELVVYLQPIVCARDQRIIGSEALVRWQHPELGLLAPAEFLPVAEEMKLIHEIDSYVLTKALAIRAAWPSDRPFPPISVNLSQMSLQDRGFIDRIAAADIPDGTISFEILETVYSDAPDEQMRWTLDELRERGFEIALDDFGTGRSSINSVIQLQPDRLKIDRSFTQHIVETERAREIVHLTVALSQTLGASVTAEGVETAEQAALLMKLGCDKLQGYFFGQPMPQHAFFQHLADEFKRRDNMENVLRA